MKRLHLAVIGFGRLGQACAEAIFEASDLELAGVVVHRETPGQPVPERLRGALTVTHVSELKQVDAALVCVPAALALGVARELLQGADPHRGMRQPGGRRVPGPSSMRLTALPPSIACRQSSGPVGIPAS
jgi:3-hydroxyisobutyrate dehydrogenase-like beta-hydroxyacid dehydrogenase